MKSPKSKEKIKEKKKARRSFSSIQPNVHNEVLTEKLAAELIDNQKNKYHWETKLNEVVYLENNLEYLTDNMLYSWADHIANAEKIRHLVIYMSVSLDLPSTKGLNQGEYFEKYFGFTAQDVSKSLLHVCTLLFLNFRVNHMDDLESRSHLLNIGDENNYVVNCYAQVRAEHGDDRVLAVFKECNRKLNHEPTIKKITGSLIKSINKKLTDEEESITLISSGAHDEYTDIELPDLSQPRKGTTPVTHSPENQKDKTFELLKGLKKQDIRIQELYDNINAYDPEDLQKILQSTKNLYQTAKSVLTR